MTNRKGSEYKYLLSQFSVVDHFLSGDTSDEEKSMSAIVSFCIVFERVYKMMLYERNSVLVYDISKAKDDVHLINIVNGVVDDNESTIRFEAIIKRYNGISNDKFTDDETEGLKKIYKLRNCLIHGYKADMIKDTEKQNINGVMSLLWKKISNQITSLFGKNIIKPTRSKLKFTEQQLKEAIKDDVRKLIKPNLLRGRGLIYDYLATDDNLEYPTAISLGFLSSEKCPRCGAYKFHIKKDELNELDRISLYNLMPNLNSEVYACDACHLELTLRQYEYAKEILNESKTDSPK